MFQHNGPYAIEVRDVDFYYSTAQKIPLFPNTHLPFKRVKITQHHALNKVSLNLKKNRVTTLLGKNGSGKTTLIKLICGSRFPKNGNILICGQPPTKHRHLLGIFMGSSLIYHRLTARENLEYFGKLYGVENLDARIEELASLLGLQSHMDNLVESYSFGMKTKLGLARAMIHSPQILILDEPTLGIDLHLAKQLRTFIRSLKCTVLLTTHYMEEAEELSDDLCLIDNGKIIGYGAKEEIFSQFEVQSVPDAFTSAIAATPSLAIPSL